MPVLIRCDNGPELIFEALRSFCADRIGIRYIPPGEPWNNGFIESFNTRILDECLNRNNAFPATHLSWNHRLEARLQPAPPALIARLPNTKRARSSLLTHPPDSRTHWHLKQGHPMLAAALLQPVPTKLRRYKRTPSLPQCQPPVTLCTTSRKAHVWTLITYGFWPRQVGIDVLEGIADNDVAVDDGLYTSRRVLQLGELLDQQQ